MGLFGGLLGWEAEDERLVDSERALALAGIRVDIRIADLGDPHPNTYRITLEHGTESHRLIALSTGGGMVEVTQIDGVPLTILGDYFETLIRGPGAGPKRSPPVCGRTSRPRRSWCGRAMGPLWCRSRAAPLVPEAVLSAAAGDATIGAVHRIAPVLPILSRRGVEVPFVTAGQMLGWSGGRGWTSPGWPRLTRAHAAASRRRR